MRGHPCPLFGVPADTVASTPCSWEAPAAGSWFQGLLRRHEQLARWLAHGRPRSFWLGGFFNPQGFLTAVKQEVARKHASDKWALVSRAWWRGACGPAFPLPGSWGMRPSLHRLCCPPVMRAIPSG